MSTYDLFAASVERVGLERFVILLLLRETLLVGLVILLRVVVFE